MKKGACMHIILNELLPSLDNSFRYFDGILYKTYATEIVADKDTIKYSIILFP